MSDSRQSDRAPQASALVLLATAATLALGLPVVRTYQGALRSSLGMRSTGLFLVVVGLGFGFLFLSVWKLPRTLAAGLGLLSLILVVRSGNVAALLTAAAILAVTLLAGDALARILRGFEATAGELSILAAAGCLGIGTALFLLGEVGLVTTPLLASAAAVLVVLRRRRVPELGRLLAGSSRRLWTGPVSGPDALWIAVVVAFLYAGFLGALRPDLSWDALAYHLPQIRDFAEKRRVLPLANLYPASFLWRTYDTYLGLPFLAGGERAVRFAHLGIGFAAFGATGALARRLGSRARCPLALLALCAVPAACLQLRNTFVDLAAALFVAASAAEVASSRSDPRRLRLAGFLFGGAIATKVFAGLAAPALGALIARRHSDLWKRLLSFAIFATILVVPWLAWSQSRLGFFLAPYYDPLKAERTNPLAPIYGPPVDPERPASLPKPELAGFLRLPYDLTFERETFVQYGEYTGVLALPLFLGLLGWGRKGTWIVLGATLSVAVALSAAASLRWIVFTARYFVPVASLYAVAAGTGLERLTDRFRGRTGEAAAVALGALALAAPIPIVSAPPDLRAAMTGASPETVLSSLASYPLWKFVHPEDRVLLLGDEDRYHCPARVIVSDTVVFPEKRIDPERWRTEWRPLAVNVILHRTDRRDAADFLRSFGPCLQTVATHGPATLYRIDWARADCRWLSSGERH